MKCPVSPQKTQRRFLIWSERNVEFVRGALLGLEPANAVMRVDANFSKSAFKSSVLMCGADIEVKGTEVDVEDDAPG